jgi:hypothetical protein
MSINVVSNTHAAVINSQELKIMATVLERIQWLPSNLIREPNFFNIGGSGYLENPTSDLMALFMGGQPNVPPWLAKALMACLVDRGISSADLAIDWSAVSAEREVSFCDEESQGSKRLDIVFGDGNFILGIENKVWAGAQNNPFSNYDALLASRAQNGVILKCVLRPNARSDDVPGDWPVISYGELVAKALAMYGQEIATGQINKWQFFYQEFLSHLDDLSSPKKQTIMNSESELFVLAHYQELEKAAKLLDLFSDQLQTETDKAIKSGFSSLNIDSILRLGKSDWTTHKALRFFPGHWGGQSQVVLTYCVDEENAEEGQLGFGIRAYIDRKHAKRSLEDICAKFKDGKSSNLPETVYPHEKDSSWYENNKRLLVLNCWPKQYTKDGAIKGIADFAKWIQSVAFDGVAANPS